MVCFCIMCMISVLGDLDCCVLGVVSSTVGVWSNGLVASKEEKFIVGWLTPWQCCSQFVQLLVVEVALVQVLGNLWWTWPCPTVIHCHCQRYLMHHDHCNLNWIHHLESWYWGLPQCHPMSLLYQEVAWSNVFSSLTCFLCDVAVPVWTCCAVSFLASDPPCVRTHWHLTALSRIHRRCFGVHVPHSIGNTCILWVEDYGFWAHLMWWNNDYDDQDITCPAFITYREMSQFLPEGAFLWYLVERCEYTGAQEAQF